MMIYFDNAATTKPHQAILELYTTVNSKYWYNESSTHHLGLTSKTLLDRASEKVLRTLNLKNKKVIFTGSASEANNLAIYGICKPYINQNMHIITSKIEHPSVLNCFHDLEKLGFEVTYLDVDENGIVDLELLKNSIQKNTILVSIMWVNNIVGSIEPMKKIIEIVKQYPRIKFHSDLVQGLTKIKLDFDLNDIDLVTFTAHKIHGLKGTGCLIINDKINLEQITKGGHQQNNLRAGTVDVAGAVCLAKVLEMENEILEKSYNYISNLHDYTIAELKKIDYLKINKGNYTTPYIINFSLNNMKGETFMHYLEQSNIYLGYGSACNAKTKALEPTIMAIYNDPNRASNAVRISLSTENTKEEVDILLSKLREIGNK